MIRIELIDGRIRQEEDAAFSLQQDACGALSLCRRSGIEPSGQQTHVIYCSTSWRHAWWDMVEFHPLGRSLS